MNNLPNVAGRAPSANSRTYFVNTNAKGCLNSSNIKTKDGQGLVFNGEDPTQQLIGQIAGLKIRTTEMGAKYGDELQLILKCNVNDEVASVIYSVKMDSSRGNTLLNYLANPEVKLGSLVTLRTMNKTVKNEKGEDKKYMNIYLNIYGSVNNLQPMYKWEDLPSHLDAATDASGKIIMTPDRKVVTKMGQFFSNLAKDLASNKFMPIEIPVSGNVVDEDLHDTDGTESSDDIPF